MVAAIFLKYLGRSKTCGAGTAGFSERETAHKMKGAKKKYCVEKAEWREARVVTQKIKTTRRKKIKVLSDERAPAYPRAGE